MIWTDSLLPKLNPPPDLFDKATNKEWFTLGSARFQLLPQQWQFLSANEEYVGYVSGYGGGKTKVGAIKSAFLSMTPGNRGLVGMEAATDLQEAAQRDLMDFLWEAQLIKETPNSSGSGEAIKKPAIVHNTYFLSLWLAYELNNSRIFS